MQGDALSALCGCGLVPVLSHLLAEPTASESVKSQVLRVLCCIALSPAGLREARGDARLARCLEEGRPGGVGAADAGPLLQDTARLSFILGGGLERMTSGGGVHVLVTYAEKDRDVAHALGRVLRREGFEVWLRGERFQYGLEVESSQAGAKGAACEVVLASAALLDSAACRWGSVCVCICLCAVASGCVRVCVCV